ncbi:MAG: T9SS type A sorting domain-containing protein [Lewinella sp.]|nr:T9SS type A sorting domain-containing protein [Lewinella sp.]
MKKIYLTLVLFWGVFACCNSQSISSSVVGSTGAYLEETGFGSLHFTVGEVAVARFDGQLELGEGFHRAETELIVFTEEVFTFRQDFQVYPNPTRDYLVVEAARAGRYEVTIIGASGQEVLPAQTGDARTRIEVQALSSGMFWLRIRDEHGETSVFPVIKVDR